MLDDVDVEMKEDKKPEVKSMETENKKQTEHVDT